jgi:hypothetical protein
MTHLVFLFALVMLWDLTISAQSTSDTVFIDCGAPTGVTKIIPYGRSKIFTITDVKYNGKMVTLSYKLENTMTEKPMAIVFYTTIDNSYCSWSPYSFSKEGEWWGYTMTENEINFAPVPSLIKKGLGDVLMRIFFIRENDGWIAFMAISNVASLKIKL